MNNTDQARILNLGVFLSGKGSNAAAIMEYFAGHPDIRVGALCTNTAASGATALALAYSVPLCVFDKTDLADPHGKLAGFLREQNIQAIVLAGFLWLVPAWLVQRYPGNIINIHPALLPAYGGKGMYGKKVHEAVWQNGEKETGITIHKVDEHYDEGDIIAQYKCPVSANDSPEDIEAKVRALELRYYPEVIGKYFSHPPTPSSGEIKGGKPSRGG